METDENPRHPMAPALPPAWPPPLPQQNKKTVPWWISQPLSLLGFLLLVFVIFALFVALHKFAFGLRLDQSVLWAAGFTAFYFVPFLGALNWLFQIIVWIACFHVVWWQALLWSALIGFIEGLLARSTVDA